MIVSRRNKYNGKVPQIDHRELVDRAFLYLKFSVGCSVVFKERVASTSENPDAMGFKHGFSYLIECKTSRADFLADGKKGFRKRPEEGMGDERYIMAPVGMLESSEIPDGWGLIEVCEMKRKHRSIKVSKDSDNFYDKTNKRAEASYLVSAIRRIDISMAVFVEDCGEFQRRNPDSAAKES